MGKVHRTSIQWATHAVNPIVAVDLETGKRGWACTKVAQGCANCYAERLNQRLGTGQAFDVPSEAQVEWEFDHAAIESVLRMRGPATIFWCDMSDMFHERAEDAWIDLCFAAMALTPHLRHIVLTKRPSRMREWVTGNRTQMDVERIAFEVGGDRPWPGWPLPNVALGVSVATQRDADELAPELLVTPAALRFVSYEPAIESVQFERWLHDSDCYMTWLTDGGDLADFCICNEPREDHISLVIIGGESGGNARPFDLAWARDTIRQCEAAGVVPMLKQLGRRPIVYHDEAQRWVHEGGGVLWDDSGERISAELKLRDLHGGDPTEWPEDLRPYACSPERWPWR